jgi:hypothetical protein
MWACHASRRSAPKYPPFGRSKSMTSSHSRMKNMASELSSRLKGPSAVPTTMTVTWMK